MTWNENIDNLIRIGLLKKADFIENEMRQYISNAATYCKDALAVTEPQSRFLLAYEGMHALSMVI